MSKKKKRTRAEVQRMKDMVMTQLAECEDRIPESANVIGQRPPYMYTALCPDPTYRTPVKEG